MDMSIYCAGALYDLYTTAVWPMMSAACTLLYGQFERTSFLHREKLLQI